jgi:hypothetical protein
MSSSLIPLQPPSAELPFALTQPQAMLPDGSRLSAVCPFKAQLRKGA